MLRRAHPHLLALACGLTLLMAPGWAAAASTPGSGGAGISGSGSSPSSASSNAEPAGRTVSVSGNGITLRASADGLTGRMLRFTGSAPRADVGRTVEIQRLSSAAGSHWLGTAHATIAPGGEFSVAWEANRSGRFSVRVVVLSATAASVRQDSTEQPSGAAPTAASPDMQITVYRSATATLYGPGFYGRRTACGQTLTRALVGVASRTLPCGTRVSILYDRRTLTVPVIDRGPYANGASWDLTMAAARALGMTGTESIGTIALS